MGRVVEVGREVQNLQVGDRVAEILDYEKDTVVAALKELTGGRGPDACIDAAGMEADHTGLISLYDKTKQALRLETGRPHALREAIQACQKGGVVSLAGVYGGVIDKVPMGAAFNKSLTLKMGQTHVHAYMQPLLEHIQQGHIDPTFVITHRMSLEDAPLGYQAFKDKQDGCVKIVLRPSM
jgi:threonine dehydrogenase-like Zn-dependent dehydrogenase